MVGNLCATACEDVPIFVLIEFVMESKLVMEMDAGDEYLAG